MQPIARTPASALKCAACGWQNFSGSTLCFNCQQALPVAQAVSVPIHAAPGAVPEHGAELDGQPQVPTAGVTDMMARVGATWLDAMQMVCSAALVLTIGLSRIGGDRAGVSLLTLLGALAFALLLPGVMDAWGGGSFGKRIAGLRMVTRNGARPGLFRSLLRHSVKFGMNLAVPVVFHLVERMVLRGHHLHEMLSGTRVVWRHATDRPTLMWWVVGSTLLPLVLLSIGMQTLTGQSGAAQTSAIRKAWAASLPLKTAAAEHLMAEGKFPTREALPIVAGQHVESIDAHTGRLVVMLDQGPSVGSLLVFWPERSTQDATRILRWRCATERMDAELAPAICKDVQPK